jgi:hypothetical protein
MPRRPATIHCFPPLFSPSPVPPHQRRRLGVVKCPPAEGRQPYQTNCKLPCATPGISATNRGSVQVQSRWGASFSHCVSRLKKSPIEYWIGMIRRSWPDEYPVRTRCCFSPGVPMSNRPTQNGRSIRAVGVGVNFPRLSPDHISAVASIFVDAALALRPNSCLQFPG